MQWGFLAFAATATVFAGASAEAGSYRLLTMDSSDLDAMTVDASLVGAGSLGWTADGPDRPGQASVERVRFTLMAAADGSTRLSLIDSLGRTQIISGSAMASSDSLSLEVVGMDSGFLFSLAELAVNGEAVNGVDTFGFGGLHKGQQPGVAVLEGLDFTAGFEITGVIETQSALGDHAGARSSDPMLRIAALETFSPGATPVPLPTAGMLAVAGFAGLSLARRRR